MGTFEEVEATYGHIRGAHKLHTSHVQPTVQADYGPFPVYIKGGRPQAAASLYILSMVHVWHVHACTEL